ncbi:MAG: hypothetical protein GX933_00720 [Chloroflexi bacterium]|nr:hypothetical protein [Chloroflexota bacterium]
MLKKRNAFFSFTTILLLLLLGSFLTGCNIPKAGPTAVPTLELDADPTSAPTVEEIAYTPTLPPLKVWLTLGSNGNSGICDLFRAALVTPELSFVQVEEVENLTPSMITADKKLVVFCGMPENLEEFTAVSGESVYAVVGNENRNLPNLWTIGYDPANELFMAGYFLGLTANDWRGSGMLPSDSALYGETASEIFSNGMHYFCGRCQSVSPPYIVFPQNVMLPESASPAEWISGMDQVSSSFPNTWYISASAETLEVLSVMLEKQHAVITSGEKPEGWQGNWLGSVHVDLKGAFTQLLQRVDNGESPTVIIPELKVITGIQASLFNEGKKRNMEAVYSNLIKGLVSPYSPVPPASFQP